MSAKKSAWRGIFRKKKAQAIKQGLTSVSLTPNQYVILWSFRPPSRPSAASKCRGRPSRMQKEQDSPAPGPKRKPPATDRGRVLFPARPPVRRDRMRNSRNRHKGDSYERNPLRDCSRTTRPDRRLIGDQLDPWPPPSRESEYRRRKTRIRRSRIFPAETPSRGRTRKDVARQKIR